MITPHQRGGRWLLVLLLVLLGVGFAHAQSSADANFLTTLGGLRDASYPDKETIINTMTQVGHPSTLPVLQAFMDGRLFFENDNQKIFIVKSTENDPANYDLIDPVTLKPAGSMSSDSMTLIDTNNHLRRVLQTAIAGFKLSSPNASVRLDAVNDMLKSLDDSTVTLLRQRSAIETNSSVKKAIATALALTALNSPDAQTRLDAVTTLRKNSISQNVRNQLSGLLDPASESDPRVRAAAASAVKAIDRWRSFYSGIETMFFGLSLGSVFVLIAIGLAITFGVMGVINMAHGELMMLGAYTTYVVQTVMPNHTEISILVAIPAAFVVAGLMGVLIERTVIRFLYGRPLETLLATFGVSLILQQLVRSIFSALNRSVTTPDWMSGTWQVNEALNITYNRLYILIFTMLVFAALLVVLRYTRAGLEIRAVSQNRAMAKAMGIRSEWVDAMTFGLGSGIAGVAGVALSQLTNVGPNLGQSYIIDSFMVVVFGGVGNLWGALIGGMSMGIVNKLLEPYSGAVLAKIFVLIALILFIQIRPRGLFPPAGRSSEN